MIKAKALNLIYDELKKGTIFGEVLEHNMGRTLFWEVLRIDHGVGKDYIMWRHYGSSANTVSKKSLQWILSEIFKMTPEEFLFKYTTYREWLRIDGCYK